MRMKRKHYLLSLNLIYRARARTHAAHTKFSSGLPHRGGGGGDGNGIVGTTNSTEKIEYLTSAKYADF